MAYRTHIKLAGDILECSQQDTSMADIRKRASTSQHRIMPMLHKLLRQGLMEQVNGDLYRTSPKGREFLQEYYTFREFSEKFGMAI